MTAPPRGSFRQIKGRDLLTDERGIGDPTVVIVPGAGLTGLDYWPIHELASTTRRSIVYDRAGTGWSDPVKLPRTARAVTDELHELLTVAGIEQAVLVGHSLGGLYARHFATRFPNQVAGLVLLDPAHQDYDSYMPPELTTAQASKFFDVLNAVADVALTTPVTRALLQRVPTIRNYQRTYQDLFTKEMRDWPVDLRDALVERHSTLDWLASGLRESRHIDELYNEVRSAAPTPDLPMIILASVATDAFQEAVATDDTRRLAQQEIDGRLRLYSALAQPLTRAEVRRIQAGHITLPFHDPDAVLRAVHDCLT